MRRRSLIAVAAVALGACHPQGHVFRALPALADDEGEAFVYLDPLRADAARLAFGIESVAAVTTGDGTPVPLQVVHPDVTGASVPRQLLLAWGRLPAGDYAALLVKVTRATLSRGDRPADLVVAKDAVRVEVPIPVIRGRSAVLALQLDAARAVTPDYRFVLALSGSVPAQANVPLTGYCTNAGLANVTVFDKHARRVTAVFASGREPQGIALDASRNRAFIALSREDQLEILDLLSGTDVGRVTLLSGDRPREVALTPDGRTLVVINEASNSAAFVDPSSGTELGRVATGEEPWSLLVDRAGRRAYVLNRRGNSITVLDVPSRAVVTTIATEPEPVRATLNRAGDRLYVAAEGSTYLTGYSVPDYAVARRVFVGLGAEVVKVDTRNDLLYVGGRGDPTLQVFDPVSPLPVNTIELPAGASYLAIDDLENTMLALLPGARTLAFVDLTARRVVGQIDVGLDPFQPTVVGER
jgi:YVTN family beta-propeller protein